MRSGAVLRIGLIGLGTVGAFHLKAYEKLQKAIVVALADSDPKRLSQIAALGQLPCYSDAAEMVARERLDIACVLTPASSHEALVSLCARAGLNVLCEKPLALEPESARRMIKEAQYYGIRLFYGSSYRFLPTLLAARQLIQSGAIGDVLLLREQALGGTGMARATTMPLSHYPADGPGGFAMGLIDHGIHLIDAFSWLTGFKVKSSIGRGNVSGGPLATEFLNIEYDSGAIGQLVYNECTFSTELPGEGMFAEGDGWDVNGITRAGEWAKHPSSIHVYGTRGSLRILHYANRLFLIDESGPRQLPVDGKPSPHHFGAQMACFVEDILADRPPSTPPEAGLVALEVLFSAYAQSVAVRM